MPKLLVFAPCEKVIISQDENNPTLIAILSTIGGEADSAEPIDPKAFAPMRWSVFSIWQRVEGDNQREFIQTLRIVAPSGRIPMDAPQHFTMTEESHRIIAQFGQIPAGEPGNWEIQLFLHENGLQRPQEPIATYPLQIRFSTKAT